MTEEEVIEIATKALGPREGWKLYHIARDANAPHIWGLVYEIPDWDGGPIVEVDERTGIATIIPGI